MDLELGQDVEVLGYDEEPKYIGVYCGAGETPGTYSIYIRDAGEFTNVPHDHVRLRG